MRNFACTRNGRPIAWTVRLVVLNILVMVGILTLFYGTNHKPLAMRLMRSVNPLSLLLPWMTQNMRLTMLNARLYDFLLVFVIAIQGLVVGSLIDLVRWLRRRKIAGNLPIV